MSILIKEMEMPTGCGAMTIKVWPDGQAEIFGEDGEYKTVEAVHVPPHGDLIDRDKLREKEFIHDGDAYAAVMSRGIRNAPTINPAEEAQ